MSFVFVTSYNFRRILNDYGYSHAKIGHQLGWLELNYSQILLEHILFRSGTFTLQLVVAFRR